MASSCTFSWTDPNSWIGACSSAASEDTVQQAAVRAKGIDPATGDWIAPQYQQANVANGGTGDAAVEAQKASASAAAFYNTQLQKNTADINAKNAACGGFIADLLNPFSPNVDPSQWNCKAANALKGINWAAVVAVVIVLAVLATAHEVREIVA